MSTDISSENKIIVSVLKIFRAYADARVKPNPVFMSEEDINWNSAFGIEPNQFLQIVMQKIGDRVLDDLNSMYSDKIVSSSETVWGKLENVLSSVPEKDLDNLSKILSSMPLDDLIGVILPMIDVLSEHIIGMLREMDEEGAGLFDKYSSSDSIQEIIEEIKNSGFDVSEGDIPPELR